ncbi:DUF3515 family protein [Brachybacterium sp. DNPG3]
MLRPRRLAAVAGGLLALSALTSCGAITVPAGPDAANPVCADVVLGLPDTLLDLDRHETTSQSTAAWGSGEDTIALRCGVSDPGPTADMCTTLENSSGVQVDWIVKEEDGIVTYTTFGRTPAIDISVPRSVAPDQPSAAALDLAGLVDASTTVTARCVGVEDVG